MKAGSAGSSPDDVTNSVIAAIQPLRDFLRVVGEAVANLNTAVVGLDAVEKGHDRPPTLNISWNPQDRIAAARKARKFVLEAVLVHVAEALIEFVSTTAQLPRFNSVRGSWSARASQAEKLTSVGATALGTDNYLIAGAALLLHWRNRVVHPRSRAALKPEQKKTLQSASNEIEQKFSGLSVDRLLQDFEHGRITLKDVSSLVAMSIRFARQVDKAASDLSADDLDFLLQHYGISTRIQEIEAQTSPSKRRASVLRMIQSVAPGLVDAYNRLHP